MTRTVTKIRLLLPVLAALVCALAAPAASAAGVAGTYRYKAQGYSGTMKIKQVGQFFTFKFSTVNKGTKHMCDFETWETPADEGGTRVAPDAPAKGGARADGVRFDIRFEGKKAYVTVHEAGENCGMSGSFDGPYSK